jgi:acetyl-CoA carboxylase biotin carboxyl carrier protein
MARKPKPAPKAAARARTASTSARSVRAKAAPVAQAKPTQNKATQNNPAQVSGGIDPALVRDIAALMNGSDLTEIEVSKGDLRIRVARETRIATAAAIAPAPTVMMQAAPVAAAPATAPVAAPAAPAANAAHILKSPMVGSAYRRPSPDAKPFVEVGDHVKEGDKVLLVEAMKTFNEILAHRSGTVTAIMIEDGEPVEYDQALMIID